MNAKTQYKPVSISLPKDVLDKIDVIAVESYKSRSDVIREVLVDRVIPTYEPSGGELKALDRAQKEIEKGNITNWDNFIKNELGNRNSKLC